MENVSSVLPLVEFSGKAWRRVKNSYIDVKVNSFFRQRDIKDPREISRRLVISDSEYETEKNGGVPFDYFYEVFFDGIEKNSSSIECISYAIVFDKYLVGLSGKNEEIDEVSICEHTEITYSTVNLGECPVFYYLYFEYQNIIDKIRERTENTSTSFPLK